MSRHLADFLGYSPEELVGRSMLELVVDPGETRLKLELLEVNGHLGHIAKLVHRSGTPVAVSYATEQMPDGTYLTQGRPLI